MALTMAQVYAYARQAGFSPDTAVIATAIAMAESGNNPKARGDIGLETSYWGPSVGLEQIRTIKSQTGKGGDRDIARLDDDPLQNMIAAYDISSHGKDFTPWTTYTSGKYRQFLGQATAAAGGATGGPVQATETAFGLPTPGEISAKLQTIAITLLTVGAGLTLLVMGTFHAVGKSAPRPGKTSALGELAQ